MHLVDREVKKVFEEMMKSEGGRSPIEPAKKGETPLGTVVPMSHHLTPGAKEIEEFKNAYEATIKGEKK